MVLGFLFAVFVFTRSEEVRFDVLGRSFSCGRKLFFCVIDRRDFLFFGIYCVFLVVRGGFFSFFIIF